MKDGLFFIADLRPKWLSDWAITFWRPYGEGYTQSLDAAGKYTFDEIQEDQNHFIQRTRNGLVTFPAKCSLVQSMAIPAPTHHLDFSGSLVVRNTRENRTKLRRLSSFNFLFQ